MNEKVGNLNDVSKKNDDAMLLAKIVFCKIIGHNFEYSENGIQLN